MIFTASALKLALNLPCDHFTVVFHSNAFQILPGSRFNIYVFEITSSLPFYILMWLIKVFNSTDSAQLKILEIYLEKIGSNSKVICLSLYMKDWIYWWQQDERNCWDSGSHHHLTGDLGPLTSLSSSNHFANFPVGKGILGTKEFLAQVASWINVSSLKWALLSNELVLQCQEAWANFNWYQTQLINVLKPETSAFNKAPK